MGPDPRTVLVRSSMAQAPSAVASAWHGCCGTRAAIQQRGGSMKRRQFLKSGAALAGVGFSSLSKGQAQPEVIQVGHLVGICMSPLFYAHATGLFQAEGIKVELKFMPNPGDALTALTGGQQHIA